MAGHSKWASIKHKKAANDAKRGKLWSKLLKEVSIAARLGRDVRWLRSARSESRPDPYRRRCSGRRKEPLFGLGAGR